jgi:Ca2+-transporting ATPase
MSVAYSQDGHLLLACKGSPESVLAVCTHRRVNGTEERLGPEQQQAVQAAAEEMAARGLRVLAFAERHLAPDVVLSTDPDESEWGLTFIGLAGLEDPPRAEVPEAIATLRAAGVRILMLTGDHPATARAIAERVGIDASRVVRGGELERLSDGDLVRCVREVSVFARITPEHKLRIVRALQRQGQIVAVTGDGVNDAPALKEAAVGVAMGRSGTEIAREAADLVLADDNFATVTVAVRSGRKLYANLRKAVRYYLAAKVALIATSLVPVLLLHPVPFAPVQIIVLELFLDLGASTTFVAEPAEADVMAQQPRDPRHPFLDRSMQLGILGGGLSLAAAVVAAYFWTLGHGDGQRVAQTAAFATWMIGHLVLAAHMRSERQPLLGTNPFANRPFLGWTAGAIALLALGTTVPFVQGRLHLVSLSFPVWGVVLAAALLVPSWWEGAKWILRRHAASAPVREQEGAERE